MLEYDRSFTFNVFVVMGCFFRYFCEQLLQTRLSIEQGALTEVLAV